MHDIAGFEAFGGEEASAGAFDVRFPDLDVHFSVSFRSVDSIVDSMKLMSIDDILGVAGSEREDFCDSLRTHTSVHYTSTKKYQFFSQHINGIHGAAFLLRMPYKASFRDCTNYMNRVHVLVTAASVDSRVKGIVYPFCHLRLESSRRNAAISSNRHSEWEKAASPEPSFSLGYQMSRT
jgi:hypothetical protein